MALVIIVDAHAAWFLYGFSIFLDKFLAHIFSENELLKLSQTRVEIVVFIFGFDFCRPAVDMLKKMEKWGILNNIKICS